MYLLKVWLQGQYHHQHHLKAHWRGKFRAPPKTSLAESLGMGPRNLGFYKLSNWFWFKFESHWPLHFWNKLSTSSWCWWLCLDVFLSANERNVPNHAILSWLETRSQMLIFVSFSLHHLPIPGSELWGNICWKYLTIAVLFLNVKL